MVLGCRPPRNDVIWLTFTMQRNAAKQPPPYGKPEKPPSILPAWAWLLGGLILGIVTSNLFYWKWQSPAQPKKAAQAQNSDKTQTTTAAATKSKQTRFDFYTMLPSMKEEELALQSDNQSEATQKYIIQVGSFRQLTQAEELKAQLALLGVEASIQTIKITEKDMWYRVYMGPFKTKEMAAQKQQQLEQAHELHSLVLKFRV